MLQYFCFIIPTTQSIFILVFEHNVQNGVFLVTVS